MAWEDLKKKILFFALYCIKDTENVINTKTVSSYQIFWIETFIENSQGFDKSVFYRNKLYGNKGGKSRNLPPFKIDFMVV